MTAAEQIQYYINLPEGKNRKEGRTASTSKESEYKVTFADDRDFIVERLKKNGKTDSLIFLYPKFIIKRDNSTVEEVNDSNIKTFFTDNEVKISIKNNLIDFLNRNNAHELFLMYKYENYKKAFEERTASLHYYKYFTMRMHYGIDFFINLAKHVPGILRNNTKYSISFVDLVYILGELSENIKYDFCEQYMRSSMTGVDTQTSIYPRSDLTNNGALRTALLNVYREYGNLVSEYLCFSLYKQGYSQIPAGHYCEYLDKNPEGSPFPVNLSASKEYFIEYLRKRYSEGSYSIENDLMQIYNPPTFDEYLSLLEEFNVGPVIRRYSSRPFYAKNKATNAVSMMFLARENILYGFGKNGRTELTIAEKDLGRKILKEAKCRFDGLSEQF